MKFTAWPDNEKPRERLLKLGPDSLSDAELLAIVLGTGSQQHHAVDLARLVIKEAGSLASLAAMPLSNYCSIAGLGPARYAQIISALHLGQRSISTVHHKIPAHHSKKSLMRQMEARLRPLPYEAFACIFLDTQQAFLGLEILFKGTLDGTTLYRREIIRRTLHFNAKYIILAHNHPMGTEEPSSLDIHTTENLMHALQAIEVNVLDHWIVGQTNCYSFAENGLL